MKRVVHAGVRKENSKFKLDYTYNAPEDLIYIEEPQLYTSIHNNDIYHFGYRFNDDVNSKDRTEFIHSVKQLGDNALDDNELEQFIKRPLKYLNDKINLYDIDCMVYPLSQRSHLVSKIVRCINDMTSHEMHKCSFEMVKNVPTVLDFNTQSSAEKFSKLQGSNILVVDDINTTGSTLHEILRKLGKINNDSNIYVYTLIGK